MGDCAKTGRTEVRLKADLADVSGDDKSISLIAPLRPEPPSDHTRAAANLRTSLRKSLKLLDSATPAHIILPDVLCAVQSAQQLGSWRLHRLATMVMAEVLLGLGKGLGPKVIEILEGVWYGIMGGNDEDVKALAALVLGKAEVEVAMSSGEDGVMLGKSTHEPD